MKIKFKGFVLILSGMSIIGVAVGMMVGYFLNEVSGSHSIIYLSTPILMIGSLLVTYGSLFYRDLK
tara:strand:+ start:526 stop:723 length:198 start_codon:yes stop_codon:yes gene_type:complete